MSRKPPGVAADEAAEIIEKAAVFEMFKELCEMDREELERIYLGVNQEARAEQARTGQRIFAIVTGFFEARDERGAEEDASDAYKIARDCGGGAA